MSYRPTHGMHGVAEVLLDLLPDGEEKEKLREQAHLRIAQHELSLLNEEQRKAGKPTRYAVKTPGYEGTYLN